MSISSPCPCPYHCHCHSVPISSFRRIFILFGLIASLSLAAIFFITQQGQGIALTKYVACNPYWSSLPSSSSSSFHVPPPVPSSSSSFPVSVGPGSITSITSPYVYGRTFGSGWGQYSGKILRHTEFNQLTPEIKSYLTQHSQHALLSRGVLLSPSVCTLPTLITECCGGNWGTGIFRLLATMKIAMMLNRTIVHKGPSYFLSVSTHVLPFHVLLEARERMNCPRREIFYINFGNPAPHNEHFWKLSNYWLQHNCTNIQYPGSTPSERSSIHSQWEPFRALRCDNLYTSSSIIPPNEPLIKISIGDQWQFIQLLQANPYYRTLNLLPSHTWNNIQHKPHDFNIQQYTQFKSYITSDTVMVCELYRSIFRVDDDIAQVIETMMEGRPFDYYMHVRSVKGGAAHYHYPRVIEYFNDQWKRWNDTHQNRNGIVSVPHPPKRIYILLDYGNRTEVCQQLEQSVPWLSCSFLSLSDYSSRYGVSLPLSLSPTLVSSQASGQGWGVLPEWANVVDMFAVWGAEYGFTNSGSAYGRLLTFIGPDCNTNRAKDMKGGALEDSPYLFVQAPYHAHHTNFNRNTSHMRCHAMPSDAMFPRITCYVSVMRPSHLSCCVMSVMECDVM